MVINFRYRFIFVHIPKVAGTSISKSLEGLPGNKRNWLASSKHETLAELQANINDRRSWIDKIFLRNPLDYFTFGLVRNPWDRMSSFYRYLVEMRPKKEIDSVTSFKDFLVQARDGVAWISALHSMRSQLDYFTYPDGTMRMDYLGHFEHMEEDLGDISSRIGCPITLPHYKKSSNSRRDYRNEYDEEMIRIVSERYFEEIAHFGYSFDQKYPQKRCSGVFHCAR